jgi:hypothetical protein
MRWTANGVGFKRYSWWRNARLDPTVTARVLWLETHPQATGQADVPADVAKLSVASSTDARPRK